VVDTNPAAVAPVQYPTDQSSYAGVALVPGSGLNGTLPAVQTSAPCSDPWLSADFVLGSQGLCWHAGGAVMHGNETFAIAWDPTRSYWQTTRDYLEQYLRDVADGSGTLSSPYSLTSQYSDGIQDTKDPKNVTGHAENASVYGGGCIDYGNPGGSACVFGNAIGNGPGVNYPSSNCSVASPCVVNDTDIQGELRNMVNSMGLIGRTQSGYTPLLVMLTPRNVVDCLDAGDQLCSVNGSSPAKFCSYHSQVNVGGQEVAYVVQPWTADTACDVPSFAALSAFPTTQQLEIDAGQRMVNPLSQSHMSAIVNPFLNGWFAKNGSEIDDNQGCTAFGYPHDAVTVGSSSQNPYELQTEYSNGGAIANDPHAGPCLHWAEFSPTFVVPSPIDQGDVVAFDGSTSVASLLVPNANYKWNFGDGTTAVGASVVHSYSAGGTYTVQLTVTDRGGNSGTATQTIQVLGPNGQPVAGGPAPTSGGSGSGSGSGGAGAASGFVVHLQLMPQSLRNVLSAGINVRLTSNQAADGIASVYIPRSAARRAHIKTGRSSSVRIGIGTVQVKNGTGTLHVRLSKATAAKLRHLGHVTLTIRLALVGVSGHRVTVVEAGRY
jgi:hypothetical protein